MAGGRNRHPCGRCPRLGHVHYDRRTYRQVLAPMGISVPTRIGDFTPSAAIEAGDGGSGLCVCRAGVELRDGSRSGRERRLAEALRSIAELAEETVRGRWRAVSKPSEEKTAHWHETEARRLRKAERLINERRIRSKYMPDDMLGEPSFDMLLDLYVASKHLEDVSVSSLCLASRVPTTTALRHIDLMERSDWVRRERDPTDGRRCFVRLTANAQAKFADWLDEI